DGYTQPGSSANTLPDGDNAVPLIVLNGTNAGSQHGLNISAQSSTIKGLVINRFTGNGILITGSGGNLVQGCFIGTDPTGATDLGNGRDGILILGSPDNIIGGTAPAQRNVISGNNLDGVQINSVTS